MKYVSSIYVRSKVDVDKLFGNRARCQYAGFGDQRGDEVWWLQESANSDKKEKGPTV